MNIPAMKSAMAGAVPKCPRCLLARGGVVASNRRCCSAASRVKLSLITLPLVVSVPEMRNRRYFTEEGCNRYVSSVLRRGIRDPAGRAIQRN